MARIRQLRLISLHSSYRREAALGKLGLNCGREEEVEQLVHGGALRGVADDDRALLDGRIEIARNDEIRAVAAEARSERGSQRDQARIGVGGVDELRGLGDVFRGDEARLEGVVELEAGERGDGGTAVGRAIGIGDGETFEGGRCGADRAKAAEDANPCAPTETSVPLA